MGQIPEHLAGAAEQGSAADDRDHQLDDQGGNPGLLARAAPASPAPGHPSFHVNKLPQYQQMEKHGAARRMKGMMRGCGHDGRHGPMPPAEHCACVAATWRSRTMGQPASTGRHSRTRAAAGYGHFSSMAARAAGPDLHLQRWTRNPNCSTAASPGRPRRDPRRARPGGTTPACTRSRPIRPARTARRRSNCWCRSTRRDRPTRSRSG